MSLEKAKQYLIDNGYKDDVLIFSQSSATVELAALALNTDQCRIAKTLSFLVNSAPILVVMAGDVRTDNKKFKEFFNEKAHMIEKDQVLTLIGHDVGGVCPFGVNKGVKVYLDESLRRFDFVYPAAGSSNSAIKITPEELFNLSGAICWIDVSKPTST